MHMLFIEQTSPTGHTTYTLHVCKRKTTVNYFRKGAESLALKNGFKVTWHYDDGTGIADSNRSDATSSPHWDEPKWVKRIHPR